eukprot:TRINITY_DN505_c0_g1_i1.p1 TRINITY_DN505_c0_g1~~TRINITY_DN505_c0_g1_i1.p1  ORF type:complete len:194 (+),score=18.03 TRINITY_DN505_c0_g1_i1:66-647(+)
MMGNEKDPFFGEEKQSDKFMVWATAIILGIFVLFCSICGIVIGILHHVYQDIMVVGNMLLLVLVLIIIFRWYREGNEDPKYKWIIIALVVVIFTIGISINALVWGLKPCEIEEQPICPNGIYFTDTRTCIENVWTTCSNQRNVANQTLCPIVYSYNPPFVRCGNCTYFLEEALQTVKLSPIDLSEATVPDVPT